MNPINLIFNLISIGLGLLCAGTLVEVLVDLEKRAAHDTLTGIVSIGEWNRQLYGEHPRQNHKNFGKDRHNSDEVKSKSGF